MGHSPSPHPHFVFVCRKTIQRINLTGEVRKCRKENSQVKQNNNSLVIKQN